MRRLVIETATAACSVALIDDGVVVAATHAVVGRGHAERLVPMIAGLPGGGRADMVLVDCGPGSFTGVRVGLSAARALGFGWGVPVRGYGSTALLAVATLIETGAAAVTVAIAGGHGEVFVQRFAGPGLMASTDLVSLSPAAAAALSAGDFVTGSGAPALLAARGDDHGGDRLPDAADARHLPAAFADLAARPVYGRPPDAKPSA